jgi:Flp pilus assembly protein TadB
LIAPIPDQERSPVRALRQKLEDEARRQARERYFAWRIVPLLAFWAALVAVVKVMAFIAIPMGVVLTVYFAGAIVCVIWLSRRAQRRIEP